jgi:hypothetical protein
MISPTRLLLVGALTLSGCTSAEDYARNNNATAGWLAANAGQPSVNVAGRWISEEWGDGELKQKGTRVTGILDEYPVGGVLNGRTLYLAITEDGWTNETAVLQLVNRNTLEGLSSESIPFNSADASPVRLQRAAP